jgi:hypothetical protein
MDAPQNSLTKNKLWDLPLSCFPFHYFKPLICKTMVIKNAHKFINKTRVLEISFIFPPLPPFNIITKKACSVNKGGCHYKNETKN